MDPTTIEQLANALDTLGTLGLAAAAIFALYTRRIRTRGEMEERVAEVIAEYAERLKYVEARRAEEREDKIAAYRRLEQLTDAVEEVADLLQGVREEVIRGTARSAPTIHE